MRTIAKVFAMAACTMMIGSPAWANDDVSDEIAEMRQLVDQLKNQVDAQSEQIEHQGEVIREARVENSQRTDERFGASGITAFLQRLEVDGHVAASYFYNFNSPGMAFNPGANSGLSGLIYPFHGNHNSFQVDQVWFGIEHPVDEENRAGFRFDLLYGTTACTLGNSAGFRCPGDDASQYYVNQAYVQYLAPVTDNGILVKAGKWGTIVGAEVAQATANFNITRGNVYNILQPIDHVGVIASSDVGETGFSWQMGVSNSATLGGTADPDFNEPKAVLFQLAWANETFSIANSVIWDTPFVGNDKTSAGIYDLLVTWDPTERISTWANFDYVWLDNRSGADAHAWGLALAGRFAVTERFGIASRFEVVRTDGGGAWANPNGPGAVSNGTIYSITGTADYALTNSLTLRTEIRYDNVTKDFNDNEFFDQGGDLRPDQTTAGVEIVYEF